MIAPLTKTEVDRARRRYLHWKQTPQVKQQLFRLYAITQHGKCAICGVFCKLPETGQTDCHRKNIGYSVATFDHIKPLSEGGRPNRISNIRMLCMECNHDQNEIGRFVKQIVRQAFLPEWVLLSNYGV